MRTIWSGLVVMVVCLLAANFASAQEKRLGKSGSLDPGKSGVVDSDAARWEKIAKAAGKADATSLTVVQFIDGYVKLLPRNASQKAKDRAKALATKMANKIKNKEGNVTKAAYVKAAKVIDEGEVKTKLDEPK
jgi:hypothetical protein